MKVTRRSGLSDIVRTRDLDITEEQYERYRKGELIQKAFPNLSLDDREFILTGATPEEWNAAYKDDDE